jgi:hypothetical protein
MVFVLGELCFVLLKVEIVVVAPEKLRLYYLLRSNYIFFAV